MLSLAEKPEIKEQGIINIEIAPEQKSLIKQMVDNNYFEHVKVLKMAQLMEKLEKTIDKNDFNKQFKIEEELSELEDMHL